MGHDIMNRASNMFNHIQSLWRDEAGFIISIELTLIATISVLGLMAGMSAMRDAVVSELSDVAGAAQDFNQSYTLFGVRGHSASTAGMDYLDRTDSATAMTTLPAC